MSIISCSTTSTTAYKVTADTTGTLVLQTGSTPTTAVTIDTAQNVGIGVVPSAWVNSGNAQIKKLSFAGNDYSLGSNYYQTVGGYSYAANDTAAKLSFYNGQFLFYTAASGTAGNAITFTQAMTLDASGNLRVGTTSGSFNGQTLYGANDTYLSVWAPSGKNAGLLFGGGGQENQGNLFYNASGNYAQLAVNPAGSYLIFSTAGSERARIDSGGNLLVGKTTTSDTTVGALMAPNGAVTATRSESTNAALSYILYSTGASNYRFYVGLGGTVYATSTSISAISDQTLKTNVRDLETGLTEVMALKPRRFDWINGDAENVAGFIAQEVEQVLPELVTDYRYNTDEEGNDIIKKSLKMGDILPTLVKAIQEQQALITTLTERITALENK